MRPTNNTKTNNSNPKTTSNSKGCTQDQPEQSTCCSPDPETGSHDNIESHTKQNDGYTNDHSEPSPCCSAESEQTTCCSNEKNETAASSCCSTNTTETEQDACSVSVVLVEQRSEEHTSELQSRGNIICRLMLEKKRRWQKQA